MRYARLLALGLALGAFLLAPVGPARGSAFSVDTKSDAVDADPGDGLCAAANGLCSLRAAIQETNALAGPDSINLPEGTHTLGIPGADEDAAATGDLDVTDDLTITGAGADATVIDGGGIDRVFHTAGSISVDISGLTIRNGATASFFPDDGFGSGLGGGVFNGTGVTLTMTGVIVAGNGASHGGGGIHNAWPSATLTLIDSAVTGNIGGVAGEGIGGGGILNLGTATLIDGLVSGNTTQQGGGGIDNGGTLTLTNSIINGNAASEFSAGGIFNSGTMTLSDSGVTNNTAKELGGGIYNVGSASLSNSTISGNQATQFDGGGIAHDAGSFTLTNSTVSGNMAGANGGGIANGTGGASPQPATLTLTNVTVSGNSAGGSGGGIANGGGINEAVTATLTNVTLSGNNAGIAGGGIVNSTISGNSAGFMGGGISNGGSLTLTNATVGGNEAPSGSGIGMSPFGDVAVGNTIMANGTGSGNCDFQILSLGHNLSNDDTCDLVGEGDLTSADPFLGSLADNGGPTKTHALLSGSPAIDAGDDSACPSTDQRGVARPVDGNGDGVPACDIGAYEAPTVSGPTPTPAPTPTPTAKPAQLPPTGGVPPRPAGGIAAVAVAGAATLAVSVVAGPVLLRLAKRRKG